MTIRTISYGNDCPAPTSYNGPFFKTAHNHELWKNDFPERHTILLDHYSEWLSRRMTSLDHSPTLATRGINVYGTSAIYQTIFITKMNVRSGPFSELENECPLWTIFRTGKWMSALDHFPNWKMNVRQKSWATFLTGKSLPNLDHFSKLENYCSYINKISVLPPNLGIITSLSNTEFISTSLSLFVKYASFSSWTEALPKYFLSSHLWRYTGELLLPSRLYRV